MGSTNDVDRQLGEARSLYEEGKELHHNESYEEAAARFGDAIKIQEVILGKYHLDTIKSYWRSGRAFALSQKDDEAALRAFQRAARMSATSFEKEINQQL